jgi:hypothetical protein
MNSEERNALQAAVLIHEQLAGKSTPSPAVYLPEYAWATIARLHRQAEMANSRGWHRAAKRLSEDLAEAIRRCHRDLEMALRSLDSSSLPRKVSTSAEIYRDILALGTEFDETDIGLGEHKLSVTTDSIALEGIELGRFQICLDWQRLGSGQAYRVLALDPNPSAKNEDVTHPHVQDETLCEGEGRMAIQAALAQGRLLDFFLLVSQLLHTYGKGSAYVELDRWHGLACDDCGTSVAEDDCYHCQSCGSNLCDDCRMWCAACEESYCSACLIPCPVCERDFCRGCMQTCSQCHKKVCARCMDDDVCQTCNEEQSQEDNDNDNDQPTSHDGQQPAGPADADQRSQGALRGNRLPAAPSSADAPAESNCLGEALVSA